MKIVYRHRVGAIARALRFKKHRLNNFHKRQFGLINWAIVVLVLWSKLQRNVSRNHTLPTTARNPWLHNRPCPHRRDSGVPGRSGGGGSVQRPAHARREPQAAACHHGLRSAVNARRTQQRSSSREVGENLSARPGRRQHSHASERYSSTRERRWTPSQPEQIVSF